MKHFPRVACLLIALAGRLDAAPVSLGDPSFEDNNLQASQWTNSLGPEWQETNGPNNGNAFEEFITGFAATGTDHLGVNLGHDVWQDLGVTYQPDTRYTLTVAAGHRIGNTQPGNQSHYLLADSTGAIYATGIFNASSLPGQSFGDAPALVFDTPSAPSAVGKTIRILLRARGAGRSHFDDIRLDATPLLPDGGASLVNQAATDITTSSATLHGEVTEIGDGAPSITLFWGTEDGATEAAAWQHSLELPGTHDGEFSGGISDLSAGTTYFFTARATNPGGESWALAAESFDTIPLPPAVTQIAASGIGATTATTGVEILADGGEIPSATLYFGTSDGGEDAGNWGAAVDLGPVDGSATTLLTGLAPGTSYYFRAFAENSGGGAWAEASSSFTTLEVHLPAIENRSATGITGTTASLRGEVTDAGNDPPAVTVFHGTTDGGDNPAAWDSSSAAGLQSGDFTIFTGGLAPETTYYFRSRAVNAAGTVWAPDTRTFTTTAEVPDTAVIHEYHFKPDDRTSLEEFIELHNPGDLDLDLGGWTISDAVDFTFPGGTVLPAGGYLVVAEDPSVILSKYGVPALGPWTGKLNSRGERIDLRDAGGVLRDRVDYGVGFPWPTGADGGGSSAELIHPGLDNDLGGSWRSSGSSPVAPVTYIASEADAWKYLKGTAEASAPVEAWRGIAFDDGTWSTGQAGFGYGYGTGHNTVLGDMRFNYSSVYFRKAFTVPAGAVPRQLHLRVRVDDGYVIWINGVEVVRRHVPDGQLAYNALAFNHTREWEDIIITEADEILNGGGNVIAVHGFNTTLGSSDFSMDLELSNDITSAAAPTPGAPNSVGQDSAVIPPQIRQVDHQPSAPAPGQPVVITAKITDPDGMGAVTLDYQTVDPGAYIRLTDPDYPTAWTTVVMSDDGSGGDAAAGDSIYTAIIPAATQTNRRLVRYRITFADSVGNAATVPYPDDEQPNFAYYVYSGLPAWQGAFRPGTTPLETYSPALLGDLPVYSLIANGTDVLNSQYNNNSDAVRFRGTFVYDGKVYDHIEFRNRGEASTYVSGKNKWRFYFNRSRDLPVKDNFGEPYPETWGSLSADACASPWAALHRGMAGVEEATSYKIYQLGGVPSPNTHYYHFRVVRGAEETPPAGSVVNDPIGNADGQYAGDFWGLYIAIERPDGSFLDERGLPDGNVYKIEGNAGDKKSQGVTQPVDSSDWNAFRDAHTGGDPTESWWRENMDLDAYHTFHSLNRLIGNVDLRGGFNHYFYHRSSDDRWVAIPWDLDMMFIAKSHWTTSINGTGYPGVIHAHKSILQHPALQLEFRNRAREILDLLASDPDPGGGQIGQLIDSFASIVNPGGQALTWADADAAMWNLHPRTNGNDGNASGQTSHRGNFYRTSFEDTRFGGNWIRWLATPEASGIMAHEDSMRYLRDYATDTWPGGSWTVNNGEQLGYGYQYLASEAADPDIPQTPVAVATGDPAFPVSDLSFSSSAFSDPQGAGTHAKTQWRLAEISGPGVPGYLPGAPRLYEIDPLWTYETTEAPGPITIPFGIATPGKTYRVRVRHQDLTGRWSHWSAPAEFAASPPPPAQLLHYWNFNEANLLAATQTIGGGTLIPHLDGGAEALGDDGQGFAGLNARHGDPAGHHLRVNGPLGASLDFALPTTGHDDIFIQYETRRSGQGAGLQHVAYTLDGELFTPFATIAVADGSPVLQVLDFRGVPDVADNPDFALRVTFEQGEGGTAGNNRFDNFTVEGNAVEPQPGTYAFWKSEHFTDPGDLADDAVSGPEATPAGDGIANIIRYAHGAGPYDPVVHLLPVIAADGDAFTFHFRFDPALTDLVWQVKGSPDLVNWSWLLFDSVAGPIPELDDGWLPVSLPASLDGGEDPDGKIFARLELQLAAP